MTRTVLVSTAVILISSAGAVPATARAPQKPVFSFGAASLRTPSRGPASLAPFKSPQVVALERPAFLPRKEVVRFDGESVFVQQAPASAGAFTAEAVLYPAGDDGTATVFSNLDERGGLSLVIDDGEIAGTVRLKGADGPRLHRIEGDGLKARAWQHVVFAGEPTGKGFETRILIDGREVARGLCERCLPLEPASPAPLRVGEKFQGYIQTFTLRDYAIPSDMIGGAVLAVGDGAERSWLENSEKVLGTLPGSGTDKKAAERIDEKIAVPFASEGYRARSWEPHPEEGGMLVLLAPEGPGDDSRPSLLARLDAERKLATVYGLFDRGKPLLGARAMVRSGGALYVLAEDRLVKFAELAAGKPRPRPTPGDAPGFDYVQVSGERRYTLPDKGRFVEVSADAEGALSVWALGMHDTGVPEVRAFALDDGREALRRTSRHYLLPASFGAETRITVARESKGEVLYSTHKGKDGVYLVHRLEPWASPDVKRLHEGPGGFAGARADVEAKRLWLAPAAGDAFLYSLRME